MNKNETVYTPIIKKIQEMIQLGEFDSWSNSWLNEMKHYKGM